MPLPRRRLLSICPVVMSLHELNIHLLVTSLRLGTHSLVMSRTRVRNYRDCVLGTDSSQFHQSPSTSTSTVSKYVSITSDAVLHNPFAQT